MMIYSELIFVARATECAWREGSVFAVIADACLPILDHALILLRS